MTTTYDEAEAARLVREARRIVARLEQGHGIKHVTHDSVPVMRAMADQIEAAGFEIKRQRERAKRIDEGERRVLADYDEVVAERDAAQAELDAARRLTDPQVDAVVTATAVLYGEGAGAHRTAADLLYAFGCSKDEVARIFDLFAEGLADEVPPILRETATGGLR